MLTILVAIVFSISPSRLPIPPLRHKRRFDSILRSPVVSVLYIWHSVIASISYLAPLFVQRVCQEMLLSYLPTSCASFLTSSNCCEHGETRTHCKPTPQTSNAFPLGYSAALTCSLYNLLGAGSCLRSLQSSTTDR